MKSLSTRPPCLTRRRIRAHGLLLAVCLWSVYAVDMSTPTLRDRNGLIKGTDFLHFYTLGTLALRGRGDLLYDMQAQSELLAQRVPQAAGTVYLPLYGPQISLLFAPFAALPYAWALAAWLVVNGFIYAACCYSLWRSCLKLHAEGWTVVILALAFPALFHLVAWGQTSGLALACFALAYMALRSQSRLMAGLAIGCLMFKPQLGLAAAVVFVFAGEWRVVAGAVLSAAFQLAVGWWHYGSGVMETYLLALRHVRDVMPLLEPRPYQMHSLRAFWSLLVPWPGVAFALYVVTAAVCLGLAVACWRLESDLGLRFSALLLTTVLISPHLTVYDLVILAPVFLFLVDHIIGYSCRQTALLELLLYSCYPLFLLGPLVRYTHLQISVAALAALLLLICLGRHGTEPRAL